MRTQINRGLQVSSPGFVLRQSPASVSNLMPVFVDEDALEKLSFLSPSTKPVHDFGCKKLEHYIYKNDTVSNFFKPNNI